MVNCAVNGCKQESYPGCGKSFHRIPANDERRTLWIMAMKLSSNVSRSACVCSLHFKDEDYATAAKARLKPDAVPSILPMVLDSTQSIVLNYKDMEIVCPGRSADIASRIMRARTVEPRQEGSSSECENEIICEPPTKKFQPKTQNSQTRKITKIRRKVKLQQYIKHLKQKLKQRDTEIDNLKEIINILVEKQLRVL